jgi:serine protease
MANAHDGCRVAYAAGLENDSGTLPAKRADVINLSLGGGGPIAAAQVVFNQARAAGVIVVAAAGNDSSDIPTFPASYDNVVSVTAVDLNRNPAPYANFGDHVDVAAPGGDTSVDRNGDGYGDGVLGPRPTTVSAAVVRLRVLSGYVDGDAARVGASR